MARRLEHDWFSRPLPTNVEIGERSWLYSSFAFSHYHSHAFTGLRVGNDTGLYDGTFFDLGPDAEIEIGDYCSLVGVILSTNGRVRIGDYSLIAHEVVIADTHWSTPVVPRGRQPAIGVSPTSIEIGKNVWIGAGASIIGKVQIGDGAIIGAGTVVTCEVPPFTVCAGNPMRVLRKIANGGGSLK